MSTTLSSTDATPASLTDEHVLTTLMSRLGRCLDTGDFDGLRHLFAADAEVTTPGGTARGHDALVAQARKRHSADAGVWHSITNPLTDIDGDEADLRANLLVAFAHDGPADPSPFLLGEVYEAHARRAADGWRLTRLRSIPVWTLNRPDTLPGD
ncbi:SnoaL-like protein [Mumia flava]|uniref:SnoaL-like protein n=1 Tax=Mumia flava TaxID=1348852 RepID=A0A2M9ARD4_9ACTN|nr:nuclear transport factor 2 family protein [Mumia flava]PJJ48265.1 SnoaL-like protein [Mumia flava]